MISSRRTLDPNSVYSTTRNGIVSIFIHDRRIIQFAAHKREYLDLAVCVSSQPLEIWDIDELLDIANNRGFH